MLTVANFDYKEYINYSRKQPDVDDDDEEPSDFFMLMRIMSTETSTISENCDKFDRKYCSA
ncbi:MAG TPA: hypothetical protein VJR94_10730 [Candidatus Nitrosocosmicus sp.]|nr:hypothetical protein [Candidatus Nitrosocosmicus sp.]